MAQGVDLKEKPVLNQQDLLFYSSLQERRERMVMMLLLFNLPGANIKMKKELLSYVEVLFDPQVEEKQAAELAIKEKKMIGMMNKEFLVRGNNITGGIDLVIKGGDNENTPEHDGNPEEKGRSDKVRRKKRKKHD